MLQKYNEMSKTFTDWKDSELSDEELAYYMGVANRVTQKLLQVS